MSNDCIPNIKKGFKNVRGAFFPDVREIAFSKENLCGNLGKLVAETNPNSGNGFMFDSDTGVYIYQSMENENVAYRIYKCFADYGFNGYNDDFLIQNLIDRSCNIDSVRFPTGVVTLEGRVIGQEIPYFFHHCTLYDYFKKFLPNCPFDYYLIILDSIMQMYNVGIIYFDLHSKNFMVDLNDHNNIEVIDFENSHVKFDDCSYISRINLLKSFRNMILHLNELCHVDCDIKELSDFESMREQLSDLRRRFSV